MVFELTPMVEAPAQAAGSRHPHAESPAMSIDAPQPVSDSRSLVFLVPPLLLYGVAVLLPILQSLFLSLFSGTASPTCEFVGLDNYVQMFAGDDVFWTAFGNSLGYLVDLPGAPARRRPRRREPPHLAAAAAGSSSRRSTCCPRSSRRSRSRSCSSGSTPSTRSACSTSCSHWVGLGPPQTAWLSDVDTVLAAVSAPGGLAVHRPLHAHPVRGAASPCRRSSRRQRGSTAPPSGRSFTRIRFPYIRPVWITTDDHGRRPTRCAASTSRTC